MGENAYFKKRGFTPLVTTPKYGINCIRRESGESRPTCVPHAHFHQVESVGRPGAQGRHSLVIVISESLVNISMQLHWSPSQTRYLMFSEMFSERPVLQWSPSKPPISNPGRSELQNSGRRQNKQIKGREVKALVNQLRLAHLHSHSPPPCLFCMTSRSSFAPSFHHPSPPLLLLIYTIILQQEATRGANRGKASARNQQSVPSRICHTTSL